VSAWVCSFNILLNLQHCFKGTMACLVLHSVHSSVLFALWRESDPGETCLKRGIFAREAPHSVKAQKLLLYLFLPPAVVRITL
jgi:hypothetical protein